MNSAPDNSTDIRQQIRDFIDHLSHVLPGQAPIKDFVHHNTLHGFQHLPFPQALAASRRLTGARGYLPLERYRQFFQQGRIDTSDLLSSLDDDPLLEANNVIIESSATTIRRRDIYLAVLTLPLQPVSSCQLTWRIEEEHALEKLDSALPIGTRGTLLEKGTTQGLNSESALTKDLWSACLETLHLPATQPHPEELLDLAPEQAEIMLNELLEGVGETDDIRISSATQRMKQAANGRLEQLINRIGNQFSLRDFLLCLSGQDLMDEIRPQLVRQLANFLDQGFAGWRQSETHQGFYDYWRSQVENDPNWLIQGIDVWQHYLELTDRDPMETIINELRRMGLQQSRWTRYLERLALELPGWSGMVLWRHNHPVYEGLTAKVDMIDYLAVRLVLERIHAHHLCAKLFQIEPSLSTLRWYFRRNHDEFTVREALFNDQLPEYLASRAQRAVNTPTGQTPQSTTNPWLYLSHLIWTWRHSGNQEKRNQPTLCRNAWPLFQTAQYLGLIGAEIRKLSQSQISDLLECLERLDEESASYIWLQAYERHYRDQILKALASNRGRGAWETRAEIPFAQLVFCMDDREEGIRRHLEELMPQVETLGAAAHFNVPHNWRGLDDKGVTPLSPVIPAPVIPVHEVCEQASSEDQVSGKQHQQRQEGLSNIGEFILQQGRRGLLMPSLLAMFAAPFALIHLAGKILLPRTFGELLHRLKLWLVPPVTTEIRFTAPNDSPEATIASPRIGFTDQEQADRVEALLRNTSLIEGFSPLVAIVGHGSRNQNNPHASAYNCGACAGHFSGPNARLVASMANRSEVRKLLAGKNIQIPDATHFIGGEHDTCNDTITWYDQRALPASLQSRFEQIRHKLQLAAAQHAQERCRRLASAPMRPSPERAYAHVAGRGLDLSQARPELGHATNACAFFGRRSMSRGAFFDRRAFLISYDASQDPTGEILEKHLLINGAVGAGISLEYYFSTVDNENYGSGSKVMHNVSGHLGVMEGASSDLRTGLPQQMIEIHEAMRLLVVVEAKTETLTAIYQRQPPIQELVGNGWVQLVAMDPDDGTIRLFKPDKGWVSWQENDRPLPTVDRSVDWYLGYSEPLSPALIKTTAVGDMDA